MKTIKDFHVRVVGPQIWDTTLDNIDIEVTLPDGRRLAATFFTVGNVEKLFEKNRTTGECLGGLYFWAADMILVKELTMDVIRRTIEHLLENGEIESAFSRLPPKEKLP